MEGQNVRPPRSAAAMVSIFLDITPDRRAVLR
jgi:hypothetical protein